MQKKILREWYDFVDNQSKRTILTNNGLCVVEPLIERSLINNTPISNQFDDVVCTKRIFEDYQLVLKEEQGIATSVTNCVDKLFNTLVSTIKNTHSQQIHPNIFKKSDTQSITLTFDENHRWQGTLKWAFYNAVNGQNLDKHTSGQYIWTNQEFSITIIGYNGKIPVAEIKEVLQHEVHHIYQHICGNQFVNKPNLLNKDTTQRFKNNRLRNRNIYSHIKGLLQSYSDNTYLKAIANILYISKGIEIEAFANGTYAWLMSKNNEKEIETDKWQTAMGRAIVGLENSVSCLKTTPTDSADYRKTIEELSQVNYSIDKVIHIGERTYQKLLKTLARTVNKVRQDLNDKEILNNTIFS